MSFPHRLRSYSITFWTFSFCLVLVHALSINALPICDSGLYGSPTYADCHGAVASIPQDRAVRFFVEQQLRTAPPQADWTYFSDPRPLEYQQTIAQTPKWWSRGALTPELSVVFSFFPIDRQNPRVLMKVPQEIATSLS